MGRFNRRGTTRVYLVTTLTVGAPTVAQITAGTRLDVAIRSLTGFTSKVDDLDAADMSSTWGKTIPGAETAESSSITFYQGNLDADVEETIRAAHTVGASRYIVFSKRGAPTAGEPVDFYPVRVAAVNDDQNADNATATFTVQYSIYDPPVKNLDAA
jgi:hypothetical protein